MAEELRLEQSSSHHLEGRCRQMEIEVRDMAIRLEQAETAAVREGKRIIVKLQSRLADLESELNAEQRRGRDTVAENRKFAKLLQEFKVREEEDQRDLLEHKDLTNSLQMKMKTLKRQLNEAEEVVAITMRKYRQAHQLLEEAERKVDVDSQTSLRVHGGQSGGSSRRSMSVVREVTRVVRV